MTLFPLTTIGANDWLNSLLKRLGQFGRKMSFHPEVVPVVDIDSLENQPLENLVTFRQTATGELVAAKAGYRFVITWMNIFGAALATDASNYLMISGNIHASADVLFGATSPPLTKEMINLASSCKLICDNNTNVIFSKTGFSSAGQAIVSGYYVRA